MNTFAQLKKNRTSDFSKLNEELNKASGKVEYKKDDERFWYPAVDKVGNGSALVRFLPAPDGEDVPFIRYWDHGFKGPNGQWYIENSLTTLGRQDPVSEYNSTLWNAGDQDTARKQKRRQHFIANIYIIEDPANPENKGTVRLYRFGKKIFDKLFAASNPAYADVEAFDPFDLWTGANFRLRMRQVEGYRNYDDSKFEANGPLFDDDKKLEAVWKKEHGLQEFLDEKNFKSYDELKIKLYRVLGLGGADQIVMDQTSSPAPVALGQTPKAFETASASVSGSTIAENDDDENLDYFKNLAEDDDDLIS